MSFLSFFKYVLFIYNFLVMLFGATLLGVAIYFYVATIQYIQVSDRTWPVYSTFFILIIAIGLLTFIVGFFGCCGACKESSCMLCLYFTIIIAICGLIGAMVFLPEKFEFKPQQIKSDLKYDIGKIMQTSYSRYNTTSFANMVIDRMQENFQCCGASNFTDWRNSLLNRPKPDIGVGDGTNFIVAPNQRQLIPQSQQQTYLNQMNQPPNVETALFRVPVSCCSGSAVEASYNQCKSIIERTDVNSSDRQVPRIPNVNSDGCVDKVYNYLFVVNWWPLNIIGGLAIGLQGLSLIFSLCLCCAINRAIDDEEYDEEK